MDIRDHSSKFTVYSFILDVDQGARVKVALSQAGYDAYYFQDPGILESRLAEAAPHLLVFTTQGLEGNLSDFVEQARKYNENIKFIVLASAEQFSILSQYNQLGVEDILTNEADAIEDRVLWSVDRVCERLYLTYQNEQLFDQWKKSQDALGQHKAEMVLPPASGGFVLSPTIVDYLSAQSKEELLQKFISRLPVVGIYFKFLPTMNSYVATHSQGLDTSNLKGLGGNFSSAEVENLSATLAVGDVPGPLAQLIQQKISLPSVRAWPLHAQKRLEGFLVCERQMPASVADKINDEFALFALCYSHFYLEKKVDDLEVQDFVTEVYNRSYYLKSLTGELDRARRQRKPLSVIKLAMDDFYEIEQAHGESTRDALLKALAQLVVQSSRINDLVCRTQANEFALVLPDCSRKGAALRAERLRRAIESSDLLKVGTRISISAGISEYPSMCHSAESLDATSTKALSHIADKGGNKICMYKAPENHMPEFEVAAES